MKMNTLIKVCIITTVHKPFDTRIFHKEAKTLAKEGYNVTLIAQHDKNEVVEGINIIALQKPQNRVSRMIFLGWKAYKLALKQNADVYHFHDPEFIIFGILLKLYNKKVIYDVHEDVPKQILNKKWIGSRGIRIVVSFIMDILEKFSTLFFTNIIVATDSIANHFPKHKTTILRNLPILKIIDDILPASSAKNKPIIIYAGGLTRIRGIREIIQSMEYINEKAELWLLGNWESDKFKEECEAVKGWVKTKYLGFKPLEEVYSLMKSAEIGISILYPVKNYLTSLPVKTYEYMACSLPVIMSDFPYWKEIFGDFALFANPNNPEDIAQQILFLLEHKDRATELGKKGREFAETRYNWETESKKLLKLYQTILTGE